MRTHAFRLALLTLGIALVGVLAAGCGSANGGHAAASRHPRPTATEETSFLRTCNRGVGAGALGDAAVCQCTLTQLEAETKPPAFRSAVVAWETNAGGAGFRSIVAQAIARCNGQQQIAPTPAASPSAVVPTVLPRARTVKLSRATYVKQFHWPDGARSLAHSCLGGTAVANGMSCTLSQAIDRAFGEYPDVHTPVVRHLHLVDPTNGRVVDVDCAVSGREHASAVCNAPQHQVALLPPPDYSD
jgi:hypothetical protein